MDTIKIKDVTSHLEQLAPISYQESYDNAGLITGKENWVVTGILITLDCTEAVVEEAIQKKCNLIVAHHPIVFRGLKKITGKTYVERTIIKALKNDICIYAIHTNLDNVAKGVNQKIAEKIGLTDLKILSPSTQGLSKLVSFIPKEHLSKVMDAVHEAGAGSVGKYDNCSFQITGTGKFRPTAEAKPHLGEVGKMEEVEEVRIEVLLASHQEHAILSALKSAHPYEEVAYYLSPLSNQNQDVGSGLIGKLQKPMEPIDFLKHLKRSMNTALIRHTNIDSIEKIEKVALCGGAGSFLLPTAKAKAADAFVSADFKYHEFFDAEDKILIADVGHYESEQFTKELLKEVLDKKFPNFAIYFSKSVTNPISYL